MALVDAAGRFLAEDAHALMASPPFSCSTMDGYALCARDAQSRVVLKVAGTVYAGDAPSALPAGTAFRIFTGATLPQGADTVVRQEAAREEAGEVALGPARPGENTRLAGEDLLPGALALAQGTRLGPLQLALLTAVRVEAVSVHRRPRVALVSTGDEIVKGMTKNSNAVALAGFIRAIGGEPSLSQVPDEVSAVASAIDSGLSQCDAALTVGGVSVGERDMVPAALALLGAEIRVHGVPMKPGKPFLFALAKGKPVFGLPGSPSACLVSFEIFARSALLALAGAAKWYRPMVRLRLAEKVSTRAGRARILWAVLEPDGRVRPVGRDAAQIRGPALAQALVFLPDGTGELLEGEEVMAWLIESEG